MKYDGYQVGIVIKSLRIQRKLTKEGLAAELGISESTIKKYENGERALSITNLFKIIDYFKVDANTILNVAESKKETSIDSRLELMDCSKKAYFQKIFNEMLDACFIGGLAMRRKKKTIECIEYLSVSAPLDKVDRLEDKQSKYIHEYVKNKEYMIVGTERRHGFSQNDVDRQWHQIVDKIRKKQVDGVIVANMSVITDNLIDAFIKIAQVQAAGGVIVTVDDGRLAMQLRGF